MKPLRLRHTWRRKSTPIFRFCEQVDKDISRLFWFLFIKFNVMPPLLLLGTSNFQLHPHHLETLLTSCESSTKNPNWKRKDFHSNLSDRKRYSPLNRMPPSQTWEYQTSISFVQLSKNCAKAMLNNKQSNKMKTS